MGASTDAERRPVSHPRSSNRTCGFPASGFPTGFTARLTNESSLGHLEATGLRVPKHHFIAEVAGAARWHRKLVLRLAIQLDLKFPDPTRCCQTHRQSPLLPSFTSTPEVRALSSAGITRPLRSYGPLRLPDWPPPFLATFGAATPSQSRASLTDPNHLPYMPCSIPRWTGSGARWLASCAFPRGFLPCPYSLPRYRGESASTSLLSRPAQASHALRPAELLAHHTWALSRGSALAGFPARTLASYQVQPTTSLGGFFPHW